MTPRHRVPTGELDRCLNVRVDSSGPVPVVVIETCRRSPSEVGESAWIATAEAVAIQLQFAGVLLEQVRHVVEQALAPKAAAAALPGAVPGQEA